MARDSSFLMTLLGWALTLGCTERDRPADAVQLTADPAAAAEHSAPVCQETRERTQPSADDASAATAPPAAVPPDPTRAPVDDVDGARLRDWIQARAEQARRGHRERVRLPIAFQSEGWGCECPWAYVGISPHYNAVDGDSNWISPLWARRVPSVRPGSEGAVIIAEGTFTGKRTTDAEGEGTTYHPFVFVIRAWRPMTEAEEPGLVAEVIRDGTSPDRRRGDPPGVRPTRSGRAATGQF